MCAGLVFALLMVSQSPDCDPEAFYCEWQKETVSMKSTSFDFSEAYDQARRSEDGETDFSELCGDGRVRRHLHLAENYLVHCTAFPTTLHFLEGEYKGMLMLPPLTSPDDLTPITADQRGTPEETFR
jgi:hypothetical protein